MRAFSNENFGGETHRSNKRKSINSFSDYICRRQKVKNILMKKLYDDPLNKKLIKESNKLFGSDSFGDWSYKNHKKWLESKIYIFQRSYKKNKENFIQLTNQDHNLSKIHLNFVRNKKLYKNCYNLIKKRTNF